MNLAKVQALKIVNLRIGGGSAAQRQRTLSEAPVFPVRKVVEVLLVVVVVVVLAVVLLLLLLLELWLLQMQLQLEMTVKPDFS